MSNAAITPGTAVLPDDGHGDHHDPHLAHHFDTPQQQYQSAKLGMWVFLGTEILMFGGLFCGYSVYRHNHPDVFSFAHKVLNRPLGAINTVVLITSSLTMAWGVRAAQLGKQKMLVWLLALTILGGFGFMAIKSVEYHHKWKDNLWFGAKNMYQYDQFKPEAAEKVAEHVEEVAAAEEKVKDKDKGIATGAPTTQPAIVIGAGGAIDPNAGGADAAKIQPTYATPSGLAHAFVTKAKPIDEIEYANLDSQDRARVSTFFSIYFVMTGLHGVHVLVGMSLIFWVLMRAASSKGKAWAPPIGLLSCGLFLIFVGVMVESGSTKWLGIVLSILSLPWAAMRVAAAGRKADKPGDFDPTYFTPVDIVGLYWHIVDLIWIFLFPLLYLIH